MCKNGTATQLIRSSLSFPKQSVRGRDATFRNCAWDLGLHWVILKNEIQVFHNRVPNRVYSIPYDATREWIKFFNFETTLPHVVFKVSLDSSKGSGFGSRSLCSWNLHEVFVYLTHWAWISPVATHSQHSPQCFGVCTQHQLNMSSTE